MFAAGDMAYDIGGRETDTSCSKDTVSRFIAP